MLDWKISIGGLFLVLLSVFVTHRLSRLRDAESHYWQVAHDLRHSLNDLLSQLEDREANPRLLIREFYPEQEPAARYILDEKWGLPRRRFATAWSRYNQMYNEQAELGMMAVFAAEITDSNRAQDPDHIYEVNDLRRRELRDVLLALKAAL